MLDIKDIKNSKVLGNKSNPISFNQKVTLLIEIEALDSAEKTKFQTFMEVRNQFMHNIEAVNYETCFAYLDGRDKYVLKAYPQKNELPIEQQLKFAFAACKSDKTTIKIDELKELGTMVRKIFYRIVIRKMSSRGVEESVDASPRKTT